MCRQQKLFKINTRQTQEPLKLVPANDSNLKVAYVLESFLSPPSNVDWLSKLVFDPLHIEDESLEVDGDGRAALSSAADFDKICVVGGS